MPTKLLIVALIVPAIAAASDRSVAEWVLRVGGSVVVEGDRTPIWDVARLPAKDFQIEAINLIDVLMEPDELKNLIGLANLHSLVFTAPATVYLSMAISSSIRGSARYLHTQNPGYPSLSPADPCSSYLNQCRTTRFHQSFEYKYGHPSAWSR